jgi:hypothetical protein
MRETGGKGVRVMWCSQPLPPDEFILSRPFLRLDKVVHDQQAYELLPAHFKAEPVVGLRSR